ncbi:unnamed protein product, partial [Trichogramma brassicae]
MTCSTAVVAGCSLEKLALLRTSRSCSVQRTAEDRQQQQRSALEPTQPHDHAWRSCGRPRRVGAEDSRSSSSRSSRSSNTRILYVEQFVQLQRDSSKIKETFIYHVAIEKMPYTNVLEIDVSTHISIIHPLIIGRVQRRRRRTRTRRSGSSSRANSKKAGAATAARRAQQQSANLRSQHIYVFRAAFMYTRLARTHQQQHEYNSIRGGSKIERAQLYFIINSRQQQQQQQHSPFIFSASCAFFFKRVGRSVDLAGHDAIYNTRKRARAYNIASVCDEDRRKIFKFRLHTTNFFLRRSRGAPPVLSGCTQGVIALRNELRGQQQQQQRQQQQKQQKSFNSESNILYLTHDFQSPTIVRTCEKLDQYNFRAIAASSYYAIRDDQQRELGVHRGADAHTL